jgi:hypothetical protein
MKAIKSFVTGLIAMTLTSTFAAEGLEVLVKRVGSSTFSFQVPEEWKVVTNECAGCYQVGNQLLYIVPSTGDHKARITVVYYSDKVPIVAQRYIEGLTYDGNVELPRIDGARAWTLIGKYGRQDSKIGTAYYQIGGGTLALDLSTVPDEWTDKALVTILKSFKELEAAN